MNQMIYEIIVRRINCPQVTVTTSTTDLPKLMELIAKWEKDCKRAGDKIEICGRVKEVVTAEKVEEQADKILSNIAQFKRDLGIRVYKKAATDGKIVPFRKVGK